MESRQREYDVLLKSEHRLLLQEVAVTKLEVRYELLKAKAAAISIGTAIGIIAVGVTQAL